MEITKTAESYISGYETLRKHFKWRQFLFCFSYCRVFLKIKEKLKGKLL